jgi:hypothetical protein
MTLRVLLILPIGRSRFLPPLGAIPDEHPDPEQLLRVRLFS